MLLEQMPNTSGYMFDPLPLIRSVNALCPLGKNRAMDTIGRFMRLQKVGESFDALSLCGVLALLLCLFGVPNPPGYFLSASDIEADPLPPVDRKLSPRFPIAIVDDVPLLLVYSANFVYSKVKVTHFMEVLRAKGKFRTAVMRPHDCPVDILRKLESSPEGFWTQPYMTERRWGIVPANQAPWPISWEILHNRAHFQLKLQLVRLMASSGFYRPAMARPWFPDAPRDLDLAWDAYVTACAKRTIQWDPIRMDYTALK